MGEKFLSLNVFARSLKAFITVSMTVVSSVCPLYQRDFHWTDFPDI
jgi:hypothetical protein